jgi:flagellar basal-body rod modification protein FlgD
MASIIDPLASSPSPASAPPPTANSPVSDPTVNKQTFLQLLVTQIKNQNPLNPTDGTQFLSQLAQFSELEQMINVNTNLQSIKQDLGNGGQAGTNPPANGPAQP